MDFSIILLIVLIAVTAKMVQLQHANTKILHQKKSSEVRIGQIAEHLAPVLDDFPHDPKKAKFLGMPVDYIIFEDDKIIFLEVKTGGARLTSTQARIKQLVLDGKITWEEFRISPTGIKVSD